MGKGGIVVMQRRNGWICSFALIGMLVVSAGGVRAAAPAGLSEVNLGDAEPAGTVSVDEAKGLWTITFGGSDIWGGADSGYFLYRNLEGNGNVTMRFLNRQGAKHHDIGGVAYDAAKTGPMMRASTDADAVTAFLPFQGERWIDPHYRFETGGGMTNLEIEIRGHIPTPDQPLWQRMERQGNRFLNLISDDGRVWNNILSVQMDNMPAGAIPVGIGGTMHGGEEPFVATYDNVTIAGTDLSPGNVVAQGRDKGALVTWNAVPGAEGYNVYVQGADRSLNRITAEATKNTSIELSDLENGKATTVVVAAVQGGKEGIGVQTVVTPNPSVGNFQGVNIGTILPGTATADANGAITMRGAGHAIGIATGTSSRADGFFYLAMPAGNGNATVKLESGPTAERTEADRQAGLMFRETLDQDARFVMVEARSESDARLQSRGTTGGVPEVVEAGLTDPTARPLWLRVVRNNNTFTGFIAEDAEGKNFVQVGDPVTIEGFSPTAYVGVALSPRTGIGAYYPAAPGFPQEFAEAKFSSLTFQ
jgi:hypothetical protein